MKIHSILLAAFLVAAPAAGFGAVNLVGDEDCFGTNGECVEDGSTWLPGGWGAVTATAEDPPYTDVQLSNGEVATFTHTLPAGSYSNTMVELRTAGIADIRGPYDVLVDGEVVGEMPLDGFGHILVETFQFSFDSSLLNDGSATVSFDPDPGDAWAVDYSKITYETGAPAVPRDATPVPVDSTWALLAMIILMTLVGAVTLNRRF